MDGNPSNRIKEIKEVIKLIQKNSVLLNEIYKRHIVNPTINELKIPKVKGYLKEISKQLNMDLKPSFEYIRTMNSKKEAINYETFRNSLILWLNYQIDVVEKNAKIMSDIQKSETNNNPEAESNKLWMTLQQRSLFILKKKFEVYKDQINHIFEENSTNNYKLSLNKLSSTLSKIFETAFFSLSELNTPSELFDKNAIKSSFSKLKIILTKFNYYVFAMLNKYNEPHRGKYDNDDGEEVEYFILDTGEETNSIPLGAFPDSVPMVYYDSIIQALADFIYLSPNCVVLDTNDEFIDQERVMFDNDLQEKFNADKKPKNQKKVLTKEEQRIINLKRIFYYYCRQQNQVGHNPTFENIESNLNRMDFSEFWKFCCDFQIPIKRKDVNKIFIEVSKGIGKELNYSDFLIVINGIAKRINEKEIERLEKRINIIKSGKVKEKPRVNWSTRWQSSDTRVSKLITKHNKAEVAQKQVYSTSKLTKKQEKTEERKEILKRGAPAAEDSKNNEERENEENPKRETRMKKLYEEQKSNNNDQNTKEKNKNNDKDQGQRTEEKTKTEKRKIEQQPHKDALIPKMLENTKNSTKNIKKKESEEEIIVEDPPREERKSSTKKEISPQQRKQEASPSNKVHTNNNKYYRLIEHPGGYYTYEHMHNKLALQIPNSVTREILASKVPEQQGKYDDIKYILQDQSRAKKEIKRCKQMIEYLKSKDFLILQEELLMYINIDDFTKVRNNLVGFNQAFDQVEKVPENYLNFLSEHFNKIDKKKFGAIKSFVEKRKDELKKEEMHKLIQMYNHNRELKLKEDKYILDQLRIYERLHHLDGNRYTDLLNKHEVYIKERAMDMNWSTLEHLPNDYFVSNREDDFLITTFVDDNADNSDDDKLNKIVGSIHRSTEMKEKTSREPALTINKSMELKTKERTKAFEESMEKKKSELLNMNTKQMNKGRDKIKKYINI